MEEPKASLMCLLTLSKTMRRCLESLMSTWYTERGPRQGLAMPPYGEGGP